MIYQKIEIINANFEKYPNLAIVQFESLIKEVVQNIEDVQKQSIIFLGYEEVFEKYYMQVKGRNNPFTHQTVQRNLLFVQQYFELSRPELKAVCSFF
jgi:hypothetical protein